MKGVIVAVLALGGCVGIGRADQPHDPDGEPTMVCGFGEDDCLFPLRGPADPVTVTAVRSRPPRKP